MIRKKADGVEWLEFEILAGEPGLVHGIFLRHGGVSPGPYASLSAEAVGKAGSGNEDEANNIRENRRRMLKALNMPRFVAVRQVHGNEVALVEEESQKAGDCDALITQKTDLALMIKHADCQAAIFYDPIRRALGNVHSGWRGNVKNIYRATVQKMAQAFGSRPEELLVGVSPSLGPENSEFINYRTELPKEFWRFQVRPEYFDLWAIARHQLLECGILSHHIEIAGICTYANAQDCFSYRRDKITGAHAALAMLR